MAWKITVDAVDLTSEIKKAATASIERVLNGRTSARFRFLDIPFPDINRFDEVVFYARDGTTPIFGGVVLRRSVTGQAVGSAYSYTDVECVGYAVYADWRYTTLAYTAPVTMETVLDDLIAETLVDHGFTVDASQVTGPTLEPFSWAEGVKVSDALRQLMARASGVSGDSYAYNVDPSKAIKAFIVGTDAAPTVTFKDVSWTDSDAVPANLINIICGPDGTELTSQVWVADGIATTWVTDIAAAEPPPLFVEVDDGTATQYLAPIGAGAAFTWDTATHTLTLGTDPLPAAGTILTLGPTVTYTGNSGYTAQFPFTVTATSAATPIIEYRESQPDIKTLAAGQEFADGKLLEFNQSPAIVTATSNEYAGWDVGQGLTTSAFGERFGVIPMTFYVSTVRITMVADEFWRYSIGLVQGGTFQGGFLEQWRELGVKVA